MMDYSIEAVDIGDKDTLRRVNQILSDTFGGEMSDQLERKTRTNSPHDSLYLAAILEDEVIGFSAFISHDFVLDGRLINCYQICWAATSSPHRGKKIFQNLINAAKEILISRGAAFMFAFPNSTNSNSGPIFIKHLGFKKIPSIKWQTPNINIILNSCLKMPETSLSELGRGSVLPNDEQLIALKSKEYQDRLLVARFNESLIWGVKRETKKLGIKLKFFDLGGMSIGDPQDIKPLFASLSRKAGKFHYFQLSSFPGNSFNEFFGNLRPARADDLVVFDLKLNTERDIRFNFFGGVKDVY